MLISVEQGWVAFRMSAALRGLCGCAGFGKRHGMGKGLACSVRVLLLVALLVHRLCVWTGRGTCLSVPPLFALSKTSGAIGRKGRFCHDNEIGFSLSNHWR